MNGTILGPIHCIRYIPGPPGVVKDDQYTAVQITQWGVIVGDELIPCDSLEAAQALSATQVGSLHPNG